jgi:RNA polymerase sigma-70 factor (ECF subfamily)
VENIELGHYHLFHAVRADLLKRAGRIVDATRAYELAIARATNERERSFLSRQLAALQSA